HATRPLLIRGLGRARERLPELAELLGGARLADADLLGELDRDGDLQVGALDLELDVGVLLVAHRPVKDLGDGRRSVLRVDNGLTDFKLHSSTSALARLRTQPGPGIGPHRDRRPSGGRSRNAQGTAGAQGCTRDALRAGEVPIFSHFGQGIEPLTWASGGAVRDSPRSRPARREGSPVATVDTPT